MWNITLYNFQLVTSFNCVLSLVFNSTDLQTLQKCSLNRLATVSGFLIISPYGISISASITFELFLSFRQIFNTCTNNLSVCITFFCKHVHINKEINC